ncbi:MAG TPA: PAN/Apple domain-containing protein, partial [Thermoanaerobaculia bacterium]|nr:PAN/Apple domain-containing protein [Thermoanaerobaculia bacterium]
MTRSFGSVVLVLAALVLPLPAVAQELTEEFGYDRKGDDYDSFRVPDVQRCQSACRKDNRCRAYTFTNEGVCYLKSRINSKKEAIGSVSGYKQDPGEDEGYDDQHGDHGDHGDHGNHGDHGGDHGDHGGYGNHGDHGPSELTEERGFDRKGNDYDSFRSRSVWDCKRACARADRCRAYTFDTRAEVCYLKSRINSKKYDSRMITGYKEDYGDDEDHGGGYDDDGVRLTEERGYDRRGADFRRFDAYSVDRCKNACAEDDR